MTRTDRIVILMTVAVSTFMATLDGSIVNVSLPTMAMELKVSIQTIQWAVSIYLMTISALLLIWGRLADLYSKKKLFMAGLCIFTLGSLVCSVSMTLEGLIAGRVIQAVGASITMALVQGIVTLSFPVEERGRALGVIGTVVALGSLTGPSLGGILVYLWGWHAIFLINLPIGVLGSVLAWRVLPDSDKLTAAPDRMTKAVSSETKTSGPLSVERFDWGGALWLFTAIMTGFLSLLGYQDQLIQRPAMATLLALSLLSFALFIRQEQRCPWPLLDLRLFQNKVFALGVLTAYLSYISLFAYVLFIPFLLQVGLKQSIVSAAMLMSIYPLMTGLLSPFFGKLSDRYGYRMLTTLGLSVNTLALAGLGLLSSSLRTSGEFLQDPFFTLLAIGVFIALLGVGSALFQSPNTSSIMGAVLRHQVGIAGSLNAFFRNFGMVTGTALALLIFSSLTTNSLEMVAAADLPIGRFLGGFSGVMFSAAALSAVGSVFSFNRH